MPTVNPLLPTQRDPWFEPGPAWWRITCRFVDGAGTALARVDTAVAVRLAGLAGGLGHASGLLGPSPKAVSAVFPDLGREAATSVSRAIASLRFQNRLATALFVRGDLSRLAAIVGDGPGVERIRVLAAQRQPAIITTWHVGATFGVSAAFRRAGVDVLFVRNLPLGDERVRARGLALALDHLRQGRLIIATPDGPGGSSTGPVSCLNRTVAFRRGPFMLARVTGAPVLPATARWGSDGRLAVELHQPLPCPVGMHHRAFEDALAADAARWLDAYMRARPREIWSYTLANLLGAPLGPGRK